MKIEIEGRRLHRRFSKKELLSQNRPGSPERSSSKPMERPRSERPEFGVFSQLLPRIQTALKQRNYVKPTEIQRQSIPYLLEGSDLLGSAQTGTGKTAAFTLPLLQHVATNPKAPRAKHARILILAPTRELAIQIRENLVAYGANLNIREAVVYGGVNQKPQEKAMKGGVDFLVATPGRLLDLMGQGMVRLDAVEALVLDEADRMLDMGFIRDIKRILKVLPKKRQTLFFSATLSGEIKTLANEMLRNPVSVSIAPEEPTVDRIAQKVMFVDDKKKYALLLSLLEKRETHKVIVFAQMKHLANKLADKLNKSGVRASAIHGNKSQSARMKALERFRSGQVRVLVATDVAARGIDVNDISHVINYHLPKEPETYVHRIGRTARAGSAGQALSFCSAGERGQLKGIEKMIRKPIKTDHEHAFHCEQAASPIEPKRKAFGKKNGNPLKLQERPRNRSWRARRPASAWKKAKA